MKNKKTRKKHTKTSGNIDNERQNNQSSIENDIEKLVNEIKKHFYNVEKIEIKINDNSEELLDYKQLEIKATNRLTIKMETFKKCLETANKFSDDKTDDKANKISIKFTNFEFNEDIKGKIKDDLSEELSKIGICYENCEFKNYEFEDCVFKTTSFKENCTFEKINFRNCRFNGEFYFKKCTAKEANFSLVEFKRNTYFNNTTFENYANFHEAEFYAVACFYGVTFKKSMNFSSAIFKDFNKTDFVNLNIENINLKDIETAVEKNYKDESYEKEKSEIDKNLEENERKKKIKELDLKYKIRWANNFRDSFRAIKHSLIETNNNLEASNFHKLELYAKEIELEYQIEKENPNFGNKVESDKTKFNKNNYAFQLKNVNNFLYSTKNIFKFSCNFALDIAPYYFIVGLVYFLMLPAFLIVFIKNILRFAFKSVLPMNYKDFKAYWVYYAKSAYIFIKFKTRKMSNFIPYVDWLLLKIYRNTSEHHTNFARILNFTICMIAIYGWFVFFINTTTAQTPSDFIYINITLLFVLVFVIYLIMDLKFKPISGITLTLLIVILFFLIIIMFGIQLLAYYSEITFFALFYILSIFSLYQLFTINNNFIVAIIRLISYLSFIFMLLISPSVILPFANLNSQEFKTEYLENNISEANKTEIIELASIINPEFNAAKNPNLDENFSISELNEYKKFIIENETILKNYIFSKNENNIKSKIKNFIAESIQSIKNCIKPSKDDNNKAKSEKIANDDISNAYLKKFEEAIYADSSRDKTIKCISFIYAIILGLCLFSLQKTARRNSVVPS